MQRTIYHDFHIAIEADDSGDGYRARILRSPEGRATIPFELPDPTEYDDQWSDRERGEARGKSLFAALFRGEVGALYWRSIARLRGAMEGQAGERQRVLRVRLACDPTDEHLAPLFDRLEWEFLFAGEAGRFLTRSRATTLVRDLEVAQPLEPLSVSEKIRILFVAPRTPASESLALDPELAAIRDSLDGANNFEIEILEDASIRGLRRRLNQSRPFHILHFVGHGKVDAARNEGILEFEDRKGGVDPVSASELADLLHGVPWLRLVVLAACETARGPGRAPERGVAAALIRTGVPCVVAMTRHVLDESATAFCPAFYEGLADGLEIDEAVTTARFAIDDTDELFTEWAIPALFMSSSDGRLLEMLPDQAPIRLGIRTRLHPIDKLDDDCDHLLDLAPHFRGRQILDPDDWNDEIEPYIVHFLRQNATTQRPVTLRMDAHLSAIFAAGRVVNTRGVDVTFRQGLPVGGFQDWHPDWRTDWDGPLWNEETIRRSEDGHEMALGVGIVRDIANPVGRYLDGDPSAAVGRLVSLTPSPEPSNTAVKGADHAWALAQAVKRLVESRDAEEEAGVLHLFLATPGALAFYLGQLSRGWGEIQLYEWEFGNPGSKTYLPSLRIASDPEDDG